MGDDKKINVAEICQILASDSRTVKEVTDAADAVKKIIKNLQFNFSEAFLFLEVCKSVISNSRID